MKQFLLAVVAVLFVNIAQAQTFTLKSADLGGQFTNKQFANGFGCTGENISPQLSWENAPNGTQAYAITMYDMDAPTGSGFWHWVVYNIPAGTTSLKSDAGNASQKNLPQGAIAGNNDAGMQSYLGPCPPAGRNHRYVITVYALRAPIQADKNASSAFVGFMLNDANTLAKASIIAYGQNQ